MTVTFTLNGEPVSRDIPPEKRLVDVLREEFSFKEIRPGCYSGACGTCTVFINGELCYSCLVPIFAVQDAEVLTYEGLESSPDFEDVLAGFDAAGCRPCANCRQSYLLSTYALLALHPVPDRDEINDFLGGRHCGCTSMNEIYNAVDQAINFRRFGNHGGK